MLKSQPAHQNNSLISADKPDLYQDKTVSFQTGVPDNYSADDEEIPEEFKYVEHVLDLSCKVKPEDSVGSGVKRGREERDSGDQGGKKIKVEGGGGKRKHLRKKRRDLGASAVVSRPSVISFAGAGGVGTDGSSTDDEDGDVRVFRRRRRRVFVRESDLGGFDVDEHFRRSLGEHAWNLVAGGVNGGNKDDKTESVVIINDSIKPSDVDDHFAKALGSETWSKIIATRQPPKRASPPESPQPTQKPVVSTTTPTPPPQQGPPPISNSNNFKIDALIGNTSSSTSKSNHVA